ncbi:MAG: DUF2283 domain-containing protein [Nanoarchaeota archaeon]
MEKTIFHYDDFSDRLFISCNDRNKKVTGSIRVLNLIVDFTTENKAVGIEILEVSKYLESLNIDSKILNNLTNAEFVFQQKIDGYLIYFILQTENQVERVPYNIVELPIINTN